MLNEHSTTGRAAVLGAGTMGAQIAAHLANIGWQVLLLDLTLDHAKQGLERVSKLKPAPFYLPELASRIELGSFETDFPRLKEADWVIEAVVEKPDIKRELWTRVQDYVAPNAVLSTNTSGLSIHEMSDACREDIKRRFLGTHFFNPRAT
jgi:3-hydroxyacyl-CoA dehydrogenase